MSQNSLERIFRAWQYGPDALWESVYLCNIIISGISSLLIAKLGSKGCASGERKANGFCQSN